MSLTARFSAAGRAQYETQRARYSSELEQFVNPSSAAGPSRTLWPDDECVPSCPIYQRGQTQAPMVDVGSYMERAFILVPHFRCPVLTSHASGVDQIAFTLLSAHDTNNGRLYDHQPGRPVVFPLTLTDFPLASDFSVSSVVTLGGTKSLPVPLHSSFGTYAIAPNDITRYGENFIMPVEIGTLGITAIPTAENQTVRVLATGRLADGSGAAGVKVKVETIDSTGAVTVTTSAASLWSSAGVFNAPVTIPAGAIGITSVALFNDNAAATELYITSLDVRLFTNTHGDYDLACQLGVFQGDASSGKAAIDTCYGVRTTSASILVTNITSALNANGYVLSCGFHGCTPAEAGVTGPVSLAQRRSVISCPLVDGMYGALAPSKELPYTSPYHPPTPRLNTGYIYCRSQDATPVQTKIEHHIVVELVTEDPMFPAADVPVWPEEVWKGLARNPDAFLIHTENKLHWLAVKAWLNKWVPKAGNFISKALANSNDPRAQALGAGIGMASKAVGSLTEVKRPSAPMQQSVPSQAYPDSTAIVPRQSKRARRRARRAMQGVPPQHAPKARRIGWYDAVD